MKTERERRIDAMMRLALFVSPRNFDDISNAVPPGIWLRERDATNNQCLSDSLYYRVCELWNRKWSNSPAAAS